MGYLSCFCVFIPKKKEEKKMKRKCKMFESQKGITLIALIVTIIILLILAGISISMLTGENGLIKNARKSQRAK